MKPSVLSLAVLAYVAVIVVREARSLLSVARSTSWGHAAQLLTGWRFYVDLLLIGAAILLALQLQVFHVALWAIVAAAGWYCLYYDLFQYSKELAGEEYLSPEFFKESRIEALVEVPKYVLATAYVVIFNQLPAVSA